MFVVRAILVGFVDRSEDGPDFIEFVLQGAVHLLQLPDSFEELFFRGHSLYYWPDLMGIVVPDGLAMPPAITVSGIFPEGVFSGI